MPLSIGQTLVGRYRVDALLGQGGFGAVYRVWDINLTRPRALKENLDASVEAQRQFGREASILADLTHPNLPRVLDYFFIPGYGQYLVMDFVEGEDLQFMLSRTGRPVPEAQAVAWISQVCDALSYLHQQNPPIVHRDVKPANIKITPSGKAVLVDFGIAKVYDAAMQTTIGARAFTPGYSPPEQYGQRHTDPRSDIYATGATLYALLTGRPPLESVVRYSGQILTPPRTINLQVSPHAETVVMRAMKIDPAERYQNVHDFKTDLTSFAAPNVVAPSWQQGSTGFASKKGADKRKQAIGAAVVVILLSFTIIIAALAANDRGGGSGVPTTPTATATPLATTGEPFATATLTLSGVPGKATATLRPTVSETPTETPRAVGRATPTMEYAAPSTATPVTCLPGMFWDPFVGRCKYEAYTTTPTPVICAPGQFWDDIGKKCRNEPGGGGTSNPPTARP
jgi:eukaryotic-like serine/threonine-protein kinase